MEVQESISIELAKHVPKSSRMSGCKMKTPSQTTELICSNSGQSGKLGVLCRWTDLPRPSRSARQEWHWPMPSLPPMMPPTAIPLPWFKRGMPSQVHQDLASIIPDKIDRLLWTPTSHARPQNLQKHPPVGSRLQQSEAIRRDGARHSPVIILRIAHRLSMAICT